MESASLPKSAVCLLYDFKSFYNYFIINSLIMVEAAKVELSRVLRTRKLILGTAATAKKTPLPDPLYVYCRKMLLASESGSWPMPTHRTSPKSGARR